jgi:hypothetical protein
MASAYCSGHSEAFALVLNGGSKSLKKMESNDSKYFAGPQQLVFEVARQSLPGKPGSPDNLSRLI